MTKPAINHFFKGITYLDIINLEEKTDLKQDSLFATSDYFIDLSQLRFVELNAITKLTLFIETLLKINDLNIFIALPTNKLSDKEANSTDFDENLRSSILNSRIKANNFIKTVGFINAIRRISEIYNKDIYITEDYSFETEFNSKSFQSSFEEIFETKSIDYSSYKYILPLEWIDCSLGLQDFTLIEKRIDKILDDKDRGLEKVDVQGIKNVVFSELIKNVVEHSKTQYALFTIGLISTTSLFKNRKGKKINPIEKDYISWIKEDNIKFQVEIYFGDTGEGILIDDFETKYKLENNNIDSKEEQLKWAFQKWSTLKDSELRRGTKGLYRIQRIVNKYNGLFNIITSNHNGGYRKGGLVNSEWVYRKCKTNTVGTFVQIKLCPYIEAREFKFSLKENSTKKKWKTVNYNPKHNVDFLDSVKNDLKTSDNLLLILNLNEFKESEVISFLEEKLPEFSFEAHPCGLVIYLLSSLKNDTLQILTDSVNEHITKITGNDVFQEIVHKDFEEVYDPVLIIGKNNKAFWYGGNQELINILNEAYSTDLSTSEISNLKSYTTLELEIKTKIRLHLENESSLINVNKEGELLFNFSNIDDLFEKIVVEKTLNNKEKNIELKYCSPKLEVVENWINYEELLKDNDYGFALSLYLKLKKLQNLLIVKQTEELNRTYLLLDHKQQLRLANSFASLYGIPKRNIKIITEDVNPNIPRRTKLFPEKNNVIVLTTVISSSETVRRLVKYIKRDSATPLIILTISNNRKYDINKLETWQEKTEIASIYTKNKKEIPKTQRDETYHNLKYERINKNLILKSPDFKTEKKSDFKNIEIKLNEELRDYIISKKVLHYNHIGIFRNRHFTFYLDKIKLLKLESFLWTKIKDSIEKWKETNSIDLFTLLIPRSLFSSDYIKNKFYAHLKEFSSSIRFIDENDSHINDPNVVYFDFGIISGKSINSIISKCAQVDNLFVCILFDQSKNGEFNLYDRISYFNNENLIVEKQTKFSIKYLYKLPLGFFTSENCPICEHRRALDFYKINLDYMYSFSEDRQNKLQLKDSTELAQVDYPFDFYFQYDKPDHELSSILIVKMFEFKMLLDMSIKHTYYRIKLYNYVLDIFKNIETELSDCLSNLYAVLYYLSHEINWLQKEPLVFKDLRFLLAQISHKVAVIDINVLIKKFEQSNDSITTPFKLAVRYKYCAISLLRSTDKLKFCESISSIINSSLDDTQTLRNNLVQNTFYHTLSLYKNTYNKSDKYYNTISDELEIISKNKLTLKQQSIVKYLEVYNNLFYLASDLKVIKSLKKYYDEYYTTNHPYPDNSMTNMDLSQFVPLGIEDIRDNDKMSEYYPDLKLLTDDLTDNWFRVSTYIDTNIKLHTEQLSDNFKNSAFFKRMGFDDMIKNIFDGNYVLGITDDLSTIIKEINENPIIYVNRKTEYDQLHSKVYHNLISRESKFSKFISQFPTDIISNIKKKFENKFEKLKIISKLKSVKVFYPEHSLTEAFDFIIDNIKKRKTEGLSFSDISIIIYISEINIQNISYIKMKIEYDSTENKNNTPNETGGLSDIKEEMKNFGGSLKYPSITNGEGLFQLNFKFIKYE
ncbi:hypothetical protein [Lacinutrix cladophorae]